MTTHVWSASGPGNASVSGNWTPSGPPGAGDIAHFNGAVPHQCTWDVAAVDEIHHQGQTVVVFAGTNVALKGLRMDTNAQISVTSATQLNFSGTAPYLSNKSYILIGATSSPFVNASSRSNLTFSIAATGTISFDCGEYPKVSLASGTFTPQFITPSVTNATDVKMLSLSIASGVTFQPTGSPAATDRTKKWIMEGDQQTQFACSAAAFDGGFATWTFQAIGSGFLLPVSGNTAAYTGTFKFHKMVIGNLNGVGTWASIGAATRLILNDLTVEAGVSLKGDTNKGSSIMLVNRPTINGTWGFVPLSDGYYVFPKRDILGFRDGGTGLNTLGSANQVLATNAGATAIEWQTVSGGGGTVDVVSNVATSKILGRVTGGSGDSEELSQAQVLAFLGNVEAGADVTDATNVTAAGALMDSEVTNLAQVKAFDESDYATAAQGGKADSAQQPPSEGAFANGDKTKLDTIETDADVTDTANVTAAGALMDSEVTNLAFVKGLQSGISDGNVITANSAVANDDFLKVDGSKVEGRSAAEVRSDLNVADGATAYTDSDAVNANAAAINNVTVLTQNNLDNITAINAKASKCFVYLSGNQSYSSGAAKIGHDTALWNVGSNYDLTAEYYVAPRDGYYLVACSYYASATPSWAMSLIYVDTGSGFAIRIRRPSANGQDNMISAVIKLDANDKVAHYAHASGSTTIQSSLNTLTYFQVTELL